MQAPILFRCALTCDYTSECTSFLRKFDKDDPDVAEVPELLNEFSERQRLLFVDGYILSDASSAGSGGSSGSQVPRPGVSAQSDCKTVSQRVFEEIETPEPKLACMQFLIICLWVCFLRGSFAWHIALAGYSTVSESTIFARVPLCLKYAVSWKR